MAQALESLFSGEPATVISSPPGAGKTTTMVDLASFLLRHCDLEVELWQPEAVPKKAIGEEAERLAAHRGLTMGSVSFPG